MANPEHLKILKQGIEVWNKWREEHPGVLPDLSGSRLHNLNLTFANLRDANLRDTFLHLTNLSNANLNGANLENAFLFQANLHHANLRYANLRYANLDDAILDGALLSYADLTGSRMGYTTLADVDLSHVQGLETVKHVSPSSIGIDTIYKSHGHIPEVFLRGCGVPESFIVQINALIVSTEPIQFYSCFISYSTKDEEFARRLYSRMRDEHLRVWFAPEDIKGGQKLHEQIERAIQLHDRLLLVLSENSMQSEWVMTEIRRARRTEIEEKRRKLFPITLVEFEKIKSWKCFDADSGKDLAIEIREYFIPDFSNWKEHDAFEATFARLLRDLKAEERP